MKARVPYCRPMVLYFRGEFRGVRGKDLQLHCHSCRACSMQAGHFKVQPLLLHATATAAACYSYCCCMLHAHNG